MKNNNQRTIKVLSGYDGSTTCTVVETIERKGKQFTTAQPGKRGLPVFGKYHVTYKGQKYITFCLPECYGELHGLCISI